MEVNEELKKEIVSLVPQQAPFRFIEGERRTLDG